ncbi:MAG: sulfite exporter TauE/SafE family protein, partial [Pelagibacteraceae bacterium]
MTLLNFVNLDLNNFVIFALIILIASIVRGFNGFGFSAISVSGLSFILPPIEIVPIILLLEVFVSIFMVPYIWNKIDWKFVAQILIGIIIGSPIGLFLLKYLSSQVTHFLICLVVIFFSLLLMRGYTNLKINNLISKILTGIVSGIANGFSTLGGLPVALFLLVTSIQPAIIRGSLAALFFLTDIYAFVLSFFGGIIDLTTIYRVLSIIIVLPLGVYIGDKFFTKAKE